MREAVFRTLAGMLAFLFLVAAVLMLKKEEEWVALVMMSAIGLLFALYATFGEYKIRWLLKLIGAKDNTSQKSG